jgi:hypothetical protein
MIRILWKLYQVLRSAECCTECLVAPVIGGEFIPASLAIPLQTWRWELFAILLFLVVVATLTWCSIFSHLWR